MKVDKKAVNLLAKFPKELHKLRKGSQAGYLLNTYHCLRDTMEDAAKQGNPCVHKDGNIIQLKTPMSLEQRKTPNLIWDVTHDEVGKAEEEIFVSRLKTPSNNVICGPYERTNIKNVEANILKATIDSAPTTKDTIQYFQNIWIKGKRYMKQLLTPPKNTVFANGFNYVTGNGFIDFSQDITATFLEKRDPSLEKTSKQTRHILEVKILDNDWLEQSTVFKGYPTVYKRNRQTTLTIDFNTGKVIDKKTITKKKIRE